MATEIPGVRLVRPSREDEPQQPPGPSLEPPRHPAPPPGFFWQGQLRQLFGLLALGSAAWAIADPALGDGAWLLPDRAWLGLGIALPALQQVLVWLVWRGQLSNRSFSRLFGARDLQVWGLLFFPLLLARPAVVLGLGLADRGSLGLPALVTWPVAAGLLALSAWALVSVKLWFGFERAAGGDHFREHYRAMPMVDRGAFAFTRNAMYRLGFLMLWAIALFCDSRAALMAAAFQQAYIHLHLWFTEEPDLRLLHSGEFPTVRPCRPTPGA